MKSNCDEILENIKTTLQECRDNKKHFFIENITHINRCKNIKKWSDDIYHNMGFSLIIKKRYLTGLYTVDYNVKNRKIYIK